MTAPSVSEPGVRVIRSILVAVDASPHAPIVLETAAMLATSLGAELHVFRAVTLPPEHPAAAHEAHRDSLERYLASEAEKQLHALIGESSTAKIVPAAAQYGAPWRLICDKAQELGVDLLVIGSHGYGGWDRLLGTTAAHVVNHATTSVFVVRRGADPTAPARAGR